MANSGRSGPQQMDWPVWHPSRAPHSDPSAGFAGCSQLVSGSTWGHKTAQVTGAPSEHPAPGTPALGQRELPSGSSLLAPTCLLSFSPAALQLYEEPGAPVHHGQAQVHVLHRLFLGKAHSCNTTRRSGLRLTGLRGEDEARKAQEGGMQGTGFRSPNQLRASKGLLVPKSKSPAGVSGASPLSTRPTPVSTSAQTQASAPHSILHH